MARHPQDIEKEIRRIEGQLLVAKQICRENLQEINQLKQQQTHDAVLQETNRLLAMKSLHTEEHVAQFNQLLRTVYEQQRADQAENRTFTYEQKEQDEDDPSLLVDLAHNVAELESLVDYAQTLCTQPITSINMLNNTAPLGDITEDFCSNTAKTSSAIEINHLQDRIDRMHEKLLTADQCEHCFIQ